jgi:hypothetical protein
MSHKGYCDKCGRETRVVRLDTGGGGGVFLCRGCWSKEMNWRRQRNKTLTGKAKFSIRKYPG